MFSLNSYTALVTGATGGIGQAIAHALAAQGARVALSGTRQNVLEEVASQLQAQYGTKPIVLPCSLTDANSLEALLPEAEEKMGKVDILVNNAGITRDSLAIRLKDEDWQQVLDVNLTACFRLCRSALKAMMKRRYGRIINISSVVGTTGNAGQANYCASKAGMVGLSKALALEVATRGITINCVAPGFIESDMTTGLPDLVKEKIISNVPVKRMGTPQEIASAVVYLASAEASYITGHTLHVNGGMNMI
ncbi:3-oxoacyl-[acyl-carrier-protein] reductase [Candidatus Finniella inopinata]|uniref:3-oxoacyl-[acyl-carrier-protein] reductase n=1 Tax=Candidatus Finniella inopinata TaxID=1696036 RepID=A0A4Q7DKP6_9PROT|nr:3-oxoacyl-[acyl-carrier-protein] reductase [Candidatus Finniella inopinata]RZI46899.1 3-oxoacyl-[acyl-carrier-protein] reductase [Candidatus Finniella inopinata]